MKQVRLESLDEGCCMQMVLEVTNSCLHFGTIVLRCVLPTCIKEAVEYDCSMRNIVMKKFFKSSLPPWVAFSNRLNIYAQFILLAYLAIWMECRLFEGMTGAFAFILFLICGAIWLLNLMAYLRKQLFFSEDEACRYFLENALRDPMMRDAE